MGASRSSIPGAVEAIRAKEAEWAEMTGQVIGLFQEGRYEEAIRIAEGALAVARGVYDPYHLNTATSLNNLAILYRAVGRDRDAQDLFREAFDIDTGVASPYRHADSGRERSV
jgi:tetratricopeptide (TPR) repeat protein